LYAALLLESPQNRRLPMLLSAFWRAEVAGLAKLQT